MWPPFWALKWSWLPLPPFMYDAKAKMSAWPFTDTVVEERLGKGLANGLDAYARPPRSLREPTRWNQDKSPETIYHIRISLYASPAAHTPVTIHARRCIDKLVDNLHIPSHLKNANEHLPPQLCLRNKTSTFAFAGVYAHLRGLWNIRSSAYVTLKGAPSNT